MIPNNFIITKFGNIIEANNTGGKTFELKNRYYSCFIVTLIGRIKFTYDGGCIVADSTHPVFIPEGLTYRNECLEDAKSLVFNYHTLEKYSTPSILAPISHRFAAEKYEEIEKALLIDTATNKMLVLGALYELAASLFTTQKASRSSDTVLNKATEYICSNYARHTLTVSQIASECFVSEIYLRKLFTQKLGIAPFSYIVGIRMSHARNLLREKLHVKEVARLVGYTDIYQFSRAYKKHFGYSPSETV